MDSGKLAWRACLLFVALDVVKLTERVQKIKRTFYCFGNTGPCLYIWVEILTFLWEKTMK